MLSYLVKNIVEEDFGCEGRPEGYEPVDLLELISDDGEEISLKVKDSELYYNNINVGDWVFFNLEEEILKVQ